MKWLYNIFVTHGAAVTDSAEVGETEPSGSCCAGGSGGAGVEGAGVSSSGEGMDVDGDQCRRGVGRYEQALSSLLERIGWVEDSWHCCWY